MIDCPSGKRQHAAKSDAWKHADALRRHAYGSPDVKPYLCRDCNWWHVGHSRGSLGFRIREARRRGTA